MRQFIVVMDDDPAAIGALRRLQGALSVTEHYGMFVALLEFGDKADDIECFPIVYPMTLEYADETTTVVVSDEQLKAWAEEQGYADYEIWWPPNRGEEQS